GDREQHGLLRRMVGVMLPRWRDEDVVGTPFQRLAVDRGRALPFDADEDGAVGRAVFLALEALRQQREVRPHGGQYGTAVDRIGVTHACAVPLVDVAGLLHALDDRPRASVGVVDYGAAVHVRGRAVRQHAGAVEGERIAVVAAGRLRRFLEL